MAQFGNKVKLTVLKGMEAIGQGASNLASNAQQRLQELNLDNQRRELLNAFPLKAYELWQKGESLPQPLEEMLKELKDVDERLKPAQKGRSFCADFGLYRTHGGTH